MWVDPAAFTLERTEEATVVHVRCELAARTSPALERVVTTALGANPRCLSLDLGECPSVDYAGVCALIRALRRAERASAAFRVQRCSEAAERVLRRMHLDGVLNLPPAQRETTSYQPDERFCRFRIRESLHIWDGLMHHTAQTVGLSPEGLVFEVPAALRTSQLLRLEMTTPDTGERFRFTGRVAHCKPGRPAVAEVEFLSLDSTMRVWLQERTPGLLPPAPPPLRP